MISNFHLFLFTTLLIYLDFELWPFLTMLLNRYGKKKSLQTKLETISIEIKTKGEYLVPLMSFQCHLLIIRVKRGGWIVLYGTRCRSIFTIHLPPWYPFCPTPRSSSFYHSNTHRFFPYVLTLPFLFTYSKFLNTIKFLSVSFSSGYFVNYSYLTLPSSS